MKKYTVLVEMTTCTYIEVEAENKADAIEIAEDECLNGDWNAMENPDCTSEVVDDEDIEPETEQETKPMLTNVECHYTGGGCWTYKAKYGPLWMYGSLGDTIQAYEADPESDDFDCDAHYVHLTFTAPTWQEITDSLSQAGADVDDGAVPFAKECNSAIMTLPCTEE